MNSSVIENDFEIEEHVANSNRFFKLTHYTLDDLNVYAEPLATLSQAAFGLAHGNVTEQQAFDAMRQASAQLKVIDEALEIENAD